VALVARRRFGDDEHRQRLVATLGEACASTGCQTHLAILLYRQGRRRKIMKLFSDPFFGFDDIGNRLATQVGGGPTGANLRAATYSPKALKQCARGTVAGAS